MALKLTGHMLTYIHTLPHHPKCNQNTICTSQFLCFMHQIIANLPSNSVYFGKPLTFSQKDILGNCLTLVGKNKHFLTFTY